MRYLAIILALGLAGCGGGALTTDAGICSADIPACPPGAFSTCEATATPITCCNGNELPACAVDAGILSSACGDCPASSGVCAIAGDGGITCDAFGEH